MKKNRFGMIAALTAALFGAGQQAKSASKSAQDFGESAHQGLRFAPNYGVTPKQYGMFVATRQSNIVKRKRRSKLAFG